ncbi:hypothetical protein BDQ17DRAFT_1250938 [Cyathus striatus]|nr:hypothetical protein BDQ17DRAFT_1250938 [Cyathus striatus]
MLAFLLTRLFLAVLTRILSAIGIVVNITVDDASPDPLTGLSITYLPLNLWNNGPTCVGCFAHVDPEEMYSGTWHDGTVSSRFLRPNRTAIYISCAIALSNNALGGYSNMTFYIDNEAVGHFERIPPGNNTYQYNVLVYSNTSMIPGEHIFVLQNGQEGGGGNRH